MPEEMDFRFSQFEIFTATGALFLCLGFVCVFTEASNIEDALGTEVIEAVGQQNLFWVSVEARGQNIVLTGAAPDYQAKKQAGEIAIDVQGVTGVTNQIAIIGEAGTCQKQIDDYLVDERVSFKTGKASLSESSYPLLGMLASIARSCNTHIEIAGHTDSRGDAAVNLKLSQRRADAVRKYLVNSGVNLDWIRAIGYGETQPIADNSTEAGRRANRRIELRVIGGAT